MQVSSSKYAMQISSPTRAASALGDVGIRFADVAGGVGVGQGFSETANASAGTPFRYSGPNQAAVTATNDYAIACGLSGGCDLNEILTERDKQITGFDPDDVTHPNQAAIELASARYSGLLNGEVDSAFLDHIQDYCDLSDAAVQGMKYRLSQLTDED